MIRPHPLLDLLRDGGHALRTFARRFAGPALADDLPIAPGDTQLAVDRLHPARLRTTVLRVRRETPTARSFLLARTDGRPFPPFHAGQVVGVHVNVNGIRTSRPYSLCSPPGRRWTAEIVVREIPGGFVSPHLSAEVAAGAELEISGPEGEFRYDPLRDTPDLVLLAGGTGIAPFLAVTQDILERPGTERILLLYGSRTPEEIIFRERLDRLAAEHEHRLRVVHVLSEPPAHWTGERGFLDADRIAGHVERGSLARRTWFVCGPPKMVPFVLAQLDRLGVPHRRIRFEPFGAPFDITAEPGWPSEVARDAVFRLEIEGDPGRPIPARADEPILVALERAGRVAPALCRVGACGACRTRLLAGRAFHPPGAALRDSDRRFGFIHPCSAHPTADVKIRLP
jgi:ferredoxin-NADP reductase